MPDVDTRAAAPPSEDAPLVIDRYELLVRNWGDPLSSSWIARTRDQRLVEVVHVDECVSRRPDLREAFLADVTGLRGTTHVSFHGFQSAGFVGGALYAARPHLETVTLQEILDRSAAQEVNAPALLRIAIEVLGALKAIHMVTYGARLVVHGDITPANILLSPEGSVFLAHSGLALAAAKPRIAAPARNPRLGYKAPEQLMEGRTVDARADVFALGVLLWEALARRKLFGGDSDADIAQRVCTQPVPRLAEDAFPGGFATSVLRAIERDPTRRFANAHDCKEALRAINNVASASDLGKWVTRHGIARIVERRNALAERGRPINRPPEARPALEVDDIDVPGPTYVAPTTLPKIRMPLNSQPEAKVVLNLPVEPGEMPGENAVLAARARRRAATVKMRSMSEELAERILLGKRSEPPKPASVPPTAATTQAAANYAPPSFESSTDTTPISGSRAKRIAAVVALSGAIGAAAMIGRAVVQKPPRSDPAAAEARTGVAGDATAAPHPASAPIATDVVQPPPVATVAEDAPPPTTAVARRAAPAATANQQPPPSVPATARPARPLPTATPARPTKPKNDIPSEI